MAEPTPDPEDPLANLPLFGDLAKALAGQGPLNWDAARHFAALGATDAATEPNVDPAARIQLEQLAAIAAPHVADVLALDAPRPTAVNTVTRGGWAQRTLDAYRPLFTDLASSLGNVSTALPETTDPMVAMLSGLSQLMNPSLFGMAIGSMVGRLAKRALGEHDLPVPRAGEGIVVVPANIDALAALNPGLNPDELRLWVLSQELIGREVFAKGTVAADLTALVRAHAAGFRPDPSALAEHLGGLDEGDPLNAMREAMSDPAIVLGAVQSAEQRELAPRLDAAFDAVVGVIDYLADSVAVRLIGGNAIDIAAAMRARRAEAAAENLYLERLLGLSLTTERVQRGKEFIAAVVDRVGEGRLMSLLAEDSALPSPSEFEAPGLWVARLEL